MAIQCRKRDGVMPKITNVQKYAILWLDHSKNSIEEISKELNLTEKQINSVLSNNVKKEGVQTKSSPVNGSNSKNLMIRETANKKKHVAIMTKESSMINDESKKKNIELKNTKDIPGIYRPNRS